MATLVSDHVYLFECSGFYKIGISKSVDERLKSIRTCCPFPVSCVTSIEYRNAAWLETYLHIKYKEFHTNGEWFRLDEDALSSVKELLQNPPSMKDVYYFLRERSPARASAEIFMDDDDLETLGPDIVASVQKRRQVLDEYLIKNGELKQYQRLSWQKR